MKCKVVEKKTFFHCIGGSNIMCLGTFLYRIFDFS